MREDLGTGNRPTSSARQSLHSIGKAPAARINGEEAMTTYAFVERPTTADGRANGNLYRDEECLAEDIGYTAAWKAIARVIRDGDTYVERFLSGSPVTLSYSEWLAQHNQRF
jgi:hypothetical protein